MKKKFEDLTYMTGAINTMARSDDLDLCYTKHCLERMRERDITISEILYILKTGIVEEYQGKAKPETGKFHKYKITAQSLSRRRNISLIILVEINRLKIPAIKLQEIVTAMWSDKKC